MAKQITFGIPAIRAGKTLALQQAISDYLKVHPKATIATVRDGQTIVEKHIEDVRPKLIGIDYGKGDVSAEVEARRNDDGSIEITAVRSWSHELELKAEPANGDGQSARPKEG